MLVIPALSRHMDHLCSQLHVQSLDGSEEQAFALVMLGASCH